MSVYISFYPTIAFTDLCTNLHTCLLISENGLYSIPKFSICKVSVCFLLSFRKFLSLQPPPSLLQKIGGSKWRGEIIIMVWVTRATHGVSLGPRKQPSPETKDWKTQVVYRSPHHKKRYILEKIGLFYLQCELCDMNSCFYYFKLFLGITLQTKALWDIQGPAGTQ